MSKAAVIYWSGTGNTEAMAKAVEEGVKTAGVECDVIPVDEASASRLADYSGIAFGCPAMGDEELEDTEFQPMWNAVSGAIAGKKIGLFGSYGWGDGDWMRR